MNYFSYLLLGPGLGQLALVCLVIGVGLLLLPELVQPIHGFKVRKVLGSLLIFVGLINIIIVLLQGCQMINATQFDSLHQAMHRTDEGQAILSHYGKDWAELTQIDYFVLDKLLARKRHPHFIHPTVKHKQKKQLN